MVSVMLLRVVVMVIIIGFEMALDEHIRAFSAGRCLLYNMLLVKRTSRYP